MSDALFNVCHTEKLTMQARQRLLRLKRRIIEDAIGCGSHVSEKYLWLGFKNSMGKHLGIQSQSNKNTKDKDEWRSFQPTPCQPPESRPSSPSALSSLWNFSKKYNLFMARDIKIVDSPQNLPFWWRGGWLGFPAVCWNTAVSLGFLLHPRHDFSSPALRMGVKRAEVETSFSGMCSGKGCPSPVVLSANWKKKEGKKETKEGESRCFFSLVEYHFPSSQVSSLCC